MNDHDDDDFDPEELTDDEIEQMVQSAVTQLLNLAVGVADLQTSDSAAEEILMLCDVVAEYMGIERSELVFEDSPAEESTRTEPIPGVIRTDGRLKFRVSDYNNLNKGKPPQDEQTTD